MGNKFGTNLYVPQIFGQNTINRRCGLIPIPCISAMTSALFWWIHVQFPRFLRSHHFFIAFQSLQSFLKTFKPLSTDTTKVLSLLARYLSYTQQWHTTWQRDRQSNGKIFRQIAPIKSAQFETYSNFWIAPCILQVTYWKNVVYLEILEIDYFWKTIH